MTAEQVLRAALIKQMYDYTYRDLAFYFADSESIRRFMGLGLTGRTFKHAALQDNISKIRPSTWKAINRVLLDWAKDKKMEKGRQVRIDCTVVEANIHPPSDSRLLYDCVRVLVRLLEQGREQWDGIAVQNHNRRAKRRMMSILNAKNQKARTAAYRDLLKVARKMVGYAERTLDRLESLGRPEVHEYALELVRYLILTRRID